MKLLDREGDKGEDLEVEEIGCERGGKEVGENMCLKGVYVGLNLL